MTRLSETDKRFLERASDVNDLDDVVRELGIEDSHTTPAEAVRELKVEVERLQAAKRRALAVADGRSLENVRLRVALNNSQSLLVAMLLEGRPESEIEAQVGENRTALGPID